MKTKLLFILFVVLAFGIGNSQTKYSFNHLSGNSGGFRSIGMSPSGPEILISNTLDFVDHVFYQTAITEDAFTFTIKTNPTYASSFTFYDMTWRNYRETARVLAAGTQIVFKRGALPDVTWTLSAAALDGDTTAKTIFGESSPVTGVTEMLITVDLDGFSNTTNNIEFKDITLIAAPLVKSQGAYLIDFTDASVFGEAEADYGAAITERGFVYAIKTTNSNPLIAGTGVLKAMKGSGIGSFNSALTGLMSDTKYAFKAYAISSAGVGYSAVTTFSTLDNIPPTFNNVGSTPIDNATGIATAATISIGFNENIKKGTGTIILRDVTGAKNFQVFDVSTATATSSPLAGALGILNDKLYINPTNVLSATNVYAVKIAATAIDDTSNNSFAGITNTTTFNFTTTDDLDPLFRSVGSIPKDNEIEVAATANIIVDFDENIKKGTGSIILRNVLAASNFEVFDMATATATSSPLAGTLGILNDKLYINPTNSLAVGGTIYAVQIAATAIDDTSNNSFAGITDETTFNFRTTDNIPPTFNSIGSTPIDNATEIATATTIVVDFDENIVAGSGTIILRDVTAASDFEVFDSATATATSSPSAGALGILNDKLYINPTNILAINNAYAVQIATTAIRDISNNSFAGIIDETRFNFSTKDDINPTFTSATPADNSTGIAISTAIIIGFDENIVAGTGTIVLRDVTGNANFEVFDSSTATATSSPASGALGILEGKLYINPTLSLSSANVYAIQIAATAIDDTAGNSFAGISNATSLNFTTANPYPNVTIPFAGGSSVVTPYEAPSGSTGIMAYTDTHFKGEFSVNQVTGVVHITNAHPAGTYSVTVGTRPPFILTVGNAHCSQGNFMVDAAAGSTIGGDPVVGDINNDGYQDIVSGTATDQFSVNFGNGVGGFGGAINTTTTRTSISDLTIGDFNGDGNQDVATTHYATRKVAIFLGIGDGTFTNGQQSISVGTGPQSISIGDFNEDGKQDIAVANQNYGNGGSVSILIGDGLGAFTVGTPVIVGLNSKDVVIGDFNGDAHQDLATTNPNDNTVSINLGNGDATFGLKTDIAVGTNPVGIAISDFNNDNRQDFASSNYTENTVSIVLGNGNGTFSAATSVTVGTGPWDVTIADFNGDGNQDIAAANRTTNNVSVRLGDGLGGFSGSTELAVGNNPQTITVGDFNQDGLQDLITAGFIQFGIRAAINLQGNSAAIVAGATTTSTTNATDFGNATINTAIIKTYTIQNTGTSPLSVNSIVSSGTNATDFVVGGITLPASIAAGANSTFTLTFESASGGEKEAKITINNDDCIEAAYSFTVKSKVHTAPTVTTTAASSITRFSATLGGNVTDDGGLTVTERGFVYSTSDISPTIAEGATKEANGTGTGVFTASITGLIEGTKYHINTYAINALGISYGEPYGETSFFYTSVNLCGANFYDNGGPDNPYTYLSTFDEITVITPNNSGEAVELNFSVFDLKPDDIFKIYDGPDQNAPLIGTFKYISPGRVVSTHPEGALAVVFIQDGSDSHNKRGWEASVLCGLQPVTNVIIDNVLATSVVLSWDAETAVNNGYEWVIMPTGVKPDTTTAIATGTVATGVVTKTVSSLPDNSIYDVYMRTDFDGDGKGLWSTVKSFTTPCSPESLPYLEDFESGNKIDGCWIKSSYQEANIQSNCGTNLTNFLQISGSSHSVVTNVIDASGVNFLAVSFDISNGCNDISEDGELLGIDYWNGTAWQNLEDLNPIFIPQNWTTNKEYIITSGLSADFKLRFDRKGGNRSIDDLSIDNIKVEEVTCVKPVNVSVTNILETMATLSWDSSITAANGYEWVVMAEGDVPDATTAKTAGTVGTGVLATTLSGLPPGTKYNAYVRTNCSGSEKSDWSVVANFTTLFDTDNDGVLDVIDLDDDNDGILDALENDCVPITNWIIDARNTGSTASVSENSISVNGTTGRRTVESMYSTDLSTVGITADFKFNFTLDQATSKTVYIGVNQSGDNTSANFSDIDYAIFLSSTTVRITENNSLIGDFIGQQTAGAVYSIQKTGTVITYLKNDVVFYTSAIAASAADYYIDTYFKSDLGNPYTLSDISVCVMDNDKDGIINRLDLDSDNDGIPDNIEAQTTAGYIAPNADSPALYLTNNGVNSAYLGGVTPENTDGIVNPDYIDLDSDNDGFYDIAESGSELTDANTDGQTDGVVGVNGLDDTLEVSDNYADTNGIFDATQTDNFSSTGGKSNYRSQESVLSVNESLLSFLKVYALKQNLYIREVSDELLDVRIFDVLGKQVFTKEVSGSSSYSIVLPGLKTGVYFVKIMSSTVMKKTKIIVE
ncbi:FG-GAP-like repeat-containing protein [Flavicella sediminum]|uniref:FG-GAP-like repeat-containing protein n=1 Tax=Flavicella sediminum TaxID=2585141 RepID=UPI001122D596|nr:FG-GAP-like repeat-containing protein [Flavicella sediminum]